MLRTRLFLNLIPFVVILLAVGTYAIVLFSRLAHNVDESVMRNYRSVVAAQTMDKALSRIETALLTTPGGDGIFEATNFKENARIFEENLAVQRENVTEPLERSLTEQLATNFALIRKAGDTILKRKEQPERRLVYEQELLPIRMATELLIEELIRINHEDILATSRNIQKINRRITRLMLVGMVIALTVSAYACYQLGRSILDPIQALTRATAEVGRGNLDQKVPVLSNDELGELATSFNAMAAQLEAYRQSTSEEIVRLHGTMESTLASFPDPIFVLNEVGRIVLRNPAAEDFAARLEFTTALPERLQKTAGEVLVSGKDFLPHSFKEVLSFRFNGVEKSFLPRVLAMRNKENELFGVAVVLYDVTRFRLLDDAKTNLVATVSHELKTPLTSVRMVLHLLLEKELGPLATKQEELLQTARKDAERLLRILNDLLDLTRLETGHSELNREKITPAELVNSAIEESHGTVNGHGLQLTSSIDPDLPAVWVDRQRISHAFNNFLMNAVKHSPPGGEILVRVFRTPSGSIQFSVIDQGPGIEEEYQARIFDRFFRVPGQTKTGAGLGLSIAREIVVAHGGRIGVRSHPGKGSEFYFVLNSADEDFAA